MSIWGPRRQRTSAKAGLLSLFPQESAEAVENPKIVEPLPDAAEIPPDPQQEHSASLDRVMREETLAKLLRAVESTNFELKMQAAASGRIFDCSLGEPDENSSSSVNIAGGEEKPTVSHTSEEIDSAISPHGTRSAEALQEPKADLAKKTKIDLVSSSSVPWASNSLPALIPLLSVTERLFLNDGEILGDQSLSLGPPPLAEGEAIDWGFEGDLFKPSAPSGEEPLFSKIQHRVIESAPKGVVKLVDRLGESFGWLVDEQAKEDPVPQELRKADRLINPPLIAHYWTGGPARAHKIADLSSTGLYLITKDRWRPGTRILIRLQRTDVERKSKDRGISVEFMILRWGRDGLGGVFIPSVPGIHANPTGAGLIGASKQSLENFVQRLREYRRDSRELRRSTPLIS